MRNRNRRTRPIRPILVGCQIDMLLSDVAPLAKIEAAIGEPLSVERINSSDWRQLAARDAESPYGVAARAWQRSQLAGVLGSRAISGV